MSGKYCDFVAMKCHCSRCAAMTSVITRYNMLRYFQLKHILRHVRRALFSGAWGYNWATLSLGNINTETRSSRMGVGCKAADLTPQKKKYCCEIQRNENRMQSDRKLAILQMTTMMITCDMRSHSPDFHRRFGGTHCFLLQCLRLQHVNNKQELRVLAPLVPCWLLGFFFIASGVGLNREWSDPTCRNLP
jgi:hypothetical protein